MRKDTATPTPLAFRIVFDDKTQPIKPIAIEMQVAPHRLGGTFRGGGTEFVRVDELVVVRRAIHVHAVIGGLETYIRHGRGMRGGIAEGLADPEHAGRAAIVALVFLGAFFLSGAQPDAPGAAVLAQGDVRGLAFFFPRRPIADIGAQNAMIGVPIIGGDDDHLAGG
ncbi:hypothetical protein KCV01_g19820, partial [Aureobasidium melanogenum]